MKKKAHGKSRSSSINIKEIVFESCSWNGSILTQQMFGKSDNQSAPHFVLAHPALPGVKPIGMSTASHDTFKKVGPDQRDILVYIFNLHIK